MPPPAAPPIIIRPLDDSRIDAFIAYLRSHVAENGDDDTGYFIPAPRGRGLSPETEADFRRHADIDADQTPWRPVWLAYAAGHIAGHVDLHRHAESNTTHRRLLGMAVAREFRRRGIGRQLLAQALQWAQAQNHIDWVDLKVLTTNLAALRLYRATGFTEIGDTADMFRIDGQKLGFITMTKRLR